VRVPASVVGHPAVTFVLIRIAFLLGTALTLVWVLPSTTAVLAFDAYDPITDYVFGAFAQWDSDWYLGIAENGYTEQSAAFFPLYPALVYALGWVIGSNLVAGVIISLAGAAVAAWAMVEIARPLIGERAARDSMLLLALYPTAFVFTSAYSEGLFLAFATTSVLAAQRGRPWLAGLLAGFAVGTRSMGLALIPALVVLLWPKTRLQIPRLAPVILLPLMGLAAVALTFDLALDDSLAFAHAQKYWDRDPSLAGPLGGVYEALRAVPDSLSWLTSLPSRAHTPGEAFSIVDTVRMQQAQLGLWNLVDLLALVGASALTVVAWRRLGPGYAVYSVGCLAIAASAPGESIVLNSMVRFVMVDFPVLMAGAALIAPRPQLRTGVLVTLGALTAVAGATFARKNWIA
jgi:Mannosyltransferase (PIG-V)